MASARNQPRAADVDRIAAGVCVMVGLLRLRLVEERERAAAGPSRDDDPLVAPDVLRVAEVGAEIEQHLLHDERRVVARVTAPGAQDVHAALDHRARQRQQLQRRRRMHVDDQRPGRAVLRPQPDAFEVDGALASARKAVDLTELPGLDVCDVNPLGNDLECVGSCAPGARALPGVKFFFSPCQDSR